MNDAYEFLAKGGVVMLPIALCSVIALTIFLERIWVLQRERIIPKQFLALLTKALGEKRWERAVSLCDSNESTISKIARRGLDYLGQDRELVKGAMQEAGRREASYLEKFVGALGAVASVSPLLGLLGTVTGMIKVFGDVAEQFKDGAQLNAGLLANGIWEALIPTAAGLTVAIPAFLAFKYLMSRIDHFLVELEAQSSALVDLVSPPPKRHPLNSDTQETSSEESKESA